MGVAGKVDDGISKVDHEADREHPRQYLLGSNRQQEKHTIQVGKSVSTEMGDVTIQYSSVRHAMTRDPMPKGRKYPRSEEFNVNICSIL